MSTFIVCSHGTASPAGRATVAEIVDQVRALLPGVDVREAFVDVQQPDIDSVVAAAPEPPIVLPLLLSRGFHTRVDIARAVRAREGARQTGPLGPHPLLAEILRDRVVDASEPRPGDHVVLAAAGSTDPRAALDVQGQAALLRALLPVPVSVGYAAGTTPTIADAVARARADGATRVIACSYVLAPGYFADVVRAAGADLTTDVLGADPRIARIAQERLRAAS